MQIDDILSDEGNGKPASCAVDVSAFLPDVASWIFTDLPVSQIFRGRTDAVKLMQMYPTWTDEMALIVAILGLTHTSPELKGADGKAIGPSLFYAKLANSNDVQKKELFSLFLNRIRKVFPHLISFGAEVEEAKNDSGQTANTPPSSGPASKSSTRTRRKPA